MITNKYEAKTMAEHISCDCKCKFSSTACSKSNLNQIKNGIITCQYECKNHKYERDYSWNLITCILRILSI